MAYIHRYVYLLIYGYSTHKYVYTHIVYTEHSTVHGVYYTYIGTHIYARYIEYALLHAYICMYATQCIEYIAHA